MSSEPKTGLRIARRGLMLVLSSPSGAGKTTLAKALLAADHAIGVSVSATTRSPRPGEADGVDYHFVDRTRFTALKEGGELLEWAEVYGNFYGTPRRPVDEALRAGRDVLFDVDWQGARQLAAAQPQDVVRVFILPPSAEALATRLRVRNQDPPEVVARRLASAAADLDHWAEYDYAIVNDERDASLAQLRAIVAGERQRRSRMSGLEAFVRGLQAGL